MMRLFVRALNHSSVSWPGCVTAQLPNAGPSEGKVDADRQTDCHADTHPPSLPAARDQSGKGCGSSVSRHRPGARWQAVRCCRQRSRGVGAVLSSQPEAVSNPLLLPRHWDALAVFCKPGWGASLCNAGRRPSVPLLCCGAVTKSGGVTLPASPRLARLPPVCFFFFWFFFF